MKFFKGHAAEVLMASLLINIIGLFSPLYSMLVYDKVIGNNIPETLWGLTLGLVLFVSLDFVLRLMRVAIVEKSAYRSDVMTDEAVLTRLLAMTNGVVVPTGGLLAKYREFAATRDILSSSYLIAAVDLPFTVVYLIVILVIAGPLVLAILVIGAILLAASFLLRGPIALRSQKSQAVEGLRLGLLAEIVTHADLIRTSRLRSLFSERWSKLADLASASRSESRFLASVNFTILSEGALLMWVSVILVGALMTEANLLTVGGLTACSILSNRVGGQITSVVILLGRYDLFRKSRKEFASIIRETTEERAFLPPRDVTGALQLNRVTFQFPGERPPVLSELRFSIAPGERIGLVGRNGSGKSTLLKCLAGAIRPTAGSVFVDGADIAAFDPAWRASWISYKPQDPLLFEGTLEQNIRGNHIAEDVSRLHQALHVSGLHRAIERGELSLDLPIMPGGANLSGGQRQAIALARAIFVDAKVLLLDEPTAAVDHELEADIVQRLLKYCEGRTLISATHCIPLLRSLDRLIVLDGGRVVADGPTASILVERA